MAGGKYVTSPWGEGPEDLAHIGFRLCRRRNWGTQWKINTLNPPPPFFKEPWRLPKCRPRTASLAPPTKIHIPDSKPMNLVPQQGPNEDGGGGLFSQVP
jgi:hypothetical protein